MGCVVSFTPRQLYFWYPLKRRLNELRSSSGRFRDKKIVALNGIRKPDGPVLSNGSLYEEETVISSFNGIHPAVL